MRFPSLRCTALSCVLVAGLAAPAHAGVEISVQLRLNDAQGNALSGAQDLQLRLHSVPTGAGELHFEAQQIEVGAGGLAQLVLDVPANLLDGQPLYLGVTVLPEGVEMSPRMPLRPAPLAYHATVAANALQLDGQPASAFIDTGAGAQIKQGDLRVGGALGLGAPTLCNGGRAGDLRYNNGRFEGCNGTTWVQLDATGSGGGGTGPLVPGDGRSAGTAGQTCKTILDGGHSSGSGVYWIQPPGTPAARRSFCDMTTEGGGWTMLGKTLKAGLTPPEQDAVRRGSWADYTEDGYGDPESHARIFWMPLSYWHALTVAWPINRFWSQTDSHQVRVTGLSIGNAASKYQLDWGGVESGFRDIQSPHRGNRFTTFDNDNDSWPQNCSSQNVGFNGGFWYDDCQQSSMLHSNGNVYSFHNNVGSSVAFNQLWFREVVVPSGDGSAANAAGATCKQILDQHGGADGVYWIDAGNGAFQTYCNMSAGGWTLLAKTVKAGLTAAERATVRESFYVTYAEDGYGSPAPAARIFWLPLREWHALTARQPGGQLWSDTSHSSDVRVNDFSVGTPAAEFPWTWSGTASGFLSIDNNLKNRLFTARDNDNDSWSGNCSSTNVGLNGGFWYSNCNQLSMLHSNGNVYSLHNNRGASVAFNFVYWRE